MTALRKLGSASDSLALVARVLALASRPGEDALAGALASEARRLLGFSVASLITLPDRDGNARVAGAGGPVRAVPVSALGAAVSFAASGEDHARVTVRPPWPWPARWAWPSRQRPCCSCA